jgi:hypothetical protein
MDNLCCDSEDELSPEVPLEICILADEATEDGTVLVSGSALLRMVGG